jgi:hypothetical protein
MVPERKTIPSLSKFREFTKFLLLILYSELYTCWITGTKYSTSYVYRARVPRPGAWPGGQNSETVKTAKTAKNCKKGGENGFQSWNSYSGFPIQESTIESRLSPPHEQLLGMMRTMLSHYRPKHLPTHDHSRLYQINGNRPV